MKCEDCAYSDIADWEQDTKTGKATPIYWCGKLKHLCDDIQECEPKGENKKECSTCKSDNSLENCLGCIEYGHWELKGENNG